jgi:NAD(P)H-hydrate epimerase
VTDGPSPVPLELDDRLAAALVPTRDPRAHKGTHGSLLIVAGSLDLAGAALLVASAAVRAGAGLVRLAVPASLQPVVAGRVPEAVTTGLPETDAGELDGDAAVGHIESFAPDALVVGPGLAPDPGTTRLVERLVRSPGPPVVLDAEALNRLATRARWWDTGPAEPARSAVLTPHPREFARLEEGDAVGDDDAERAARAAAAAHRWGCVVVLKGACTVIAAPDRSVRRAPFENPALATAGTGDVLAGTIGALLAQGMATADAASLGVYLHGAAGERMRERFGDAGLTASDLPRAIALVRRDLAQLRERRAGERRLGFGGQPGGDRAPSERPR